MALKAEINEMRRLHAVKFSEQEKARFEAEEKARGGTMAHSAMACAVSCVTCLKWMLSRLQSVTRKICAAHAPEEMPRRPNASLLSLVPCLASNRRCPCPPPPQVLRAKEEARKAAAFQQKVDQLEQLEQVKQKILGERAEAARMGELIKLKAVEEAADMARKEEEGRARAKQAALDTAKANDILQQFKAMEKDRDKQAQLAIEGEPRRTL